MLEPAGVADMSPAIVVDVGLQHFASDSTGTLKCLFSRVKVSFNPIRPVEGVDADNSKLALRGSKGECRHGKNPSKIRGFVLPILAASALTACAHNNVAPPPPLAKPDPRICAPIEAPPPIQGGIVQPVTQEQVDAVTEFLRGEADLYSWGGRGWTRAELAKTRYCSP